jgi:hypothetical protein
LLLNTGALEGTEEPARAFIFIRWIMSGFKSVKCFYLFRVGRILTARLVVGYDPRFCSAFVNNNSHRCSINGSPAPQPRSKWIIGLPEAVAGLPVASASVHSTTKIAFSVKRFGNSCLGVGPRLTRRAIINRPLNYYSPRTPQPLLYDFSRFPFEARLSPK